VLERLLWHIGRLQVLVVAIRLVAELGQPRRALVLTLLLKDLRVGHERLIFHRLRLLQLVSRYRRG